METYDYNQNGTVDISKVYNEKCAPEKSDTHRI